jgi:hypothetical protein
MARFFLMIGQNSAQFGQFFDILTKDTFHKRHLGMQTHFLTNRFATWHFLQTSMNDSQSRPIVLSNSQLRGANRNPVSPLSVMN